MASDPQSTAADAEQRWLTPGVRGIGAASFLADVGHEIPTALLPNLLTVTLGARCRPRPHRGCLRRAGRRSPTRRPPACPALVGLVGARTAIIALSIIPGLLAALAIVYAIRRAPRAEQRNRQPLRGDRRGAVLVLALGWGCSGWSTPRPSNRQWFIHEIPF